MKNRTLVVGGLSAAVAASLGALSPLAIAQEAEESAFTANIGVTSNYVWRGATQNNDSAAVQGGIDYGHGPTGFYVGLWMSNVDFGGSEESTVYDADGNPIGTVETSVNAPDYELDGYIGWARDFTDDVGLDLGYVYYNYGLQGSGSDFGELYASVSFWWFEVGANYTVNSQVDDPDDTAAYVVGDIAYYGSAGFDFLETWNLSFTIGQYAFDNDSSSNELSYTWGQIDLSKSAGRYGDFMLSFSQAGEEADGNDRTKVFVTWTKGWFFKQ